MTCRSDQINNENEYRLGHWSETNSQYQDTRHTMFAPLDTPAPLEISASSPIEMSGIQPTETIGATMCTQTPPQIQTSNGRSRALSRVPPPNFNGDHNLSELFLDKFTSYEIMNGDARQFTVPFLKVTLALSYMNGPKVDSWARHK